MSIINISNPWIRRPILVASAPLVILIALVWNGLSIIPEISGSFAECWKGRWDLNEKRKLKKQATASPAGEEGN